MFLEKCQVIQTSVILIPLECEEVDGGLVSEDLLSTVVLHVATHIIAVQYGPGAPPLLLSL